MMAGGIERVIQHEPLEPLRVPINPTTLDVGGGIAGIQAAKRASELIPLCHPLSLTYVSVDFSLTDEPPAVEIITEARTSHQTGVEMEALTAAAVAALTVYDMGKSIDKGIVVEHRFAQMDAHRLSRAPRSK